jgi:Kef-type K+ transport system membrane component KefB
MTPPFLAVPFAEAAALHPHEVLLYLLLDLVIIIAAARIMGAAARRLGQPAVIGEIIAGVVMGPTLLGRLDADWPARLFPKEVPLRSLADLGLVFFMFLVGLELDSRLLRSQGKRAIQISVSGVVAPLVMGVLVGLAIYNVNRQGTFSPVEAGAELPGRLTFGLFLGAAMCITAFPVLARILVETGLYKTAVGTATLCAAAVDDVIAWILLAAVVGIVQNGSPAAAGQAFLLTAIFIAAMIFGGRRLLDILARRYDREGRLTVDMVAIILAGVLISAYCTEKIGIHSIFGAFIFGAIMPKRSGLTHELTDKVEDFVVVVMLPVFFLVTGLRTDLFTLDSVSLIGWLLLIVGVAVAGKFLGCGIAARLTGSSTSDAIVVGSLMNTRGLTELVILTIGLNLGVLSDRTFAMMVIMALTTTFMAAPIVNRLMPRSARLREIGEPETPAVSPTAVRILVAVADRAHAVDLVDAAVRLTGARRPAELVLVELVPVSRAPELRSGLIEEEEQVERTREALRPLAERATAAGVAARVLSFLTDDAPRDIARLVADQSCEVVVASWPDGGPRRIQTFAARLLAMAACDVILVPDRVGVTPAGPVVVVFSGSSHDAAALKAALAMAPAGGSLRVVGGAPPGLPPLFGPEGSRAFALWADELSRESLLTVVPEHTRWNDAEREAPEEASAVVMGLEEQWQQLPEPGGSPPSLVGIPVLRVRSADGSGAPLAAPLEAPADWPFILPSRPRTTDAPMVHVPEAPHLQRLDPYGLTSEVFPTGSQLSIGRLAANRVALLSDNLVSRNHASIDQTNGQYILRDLGSTNGTMLWRDQRWHDVTSEPLKDGDLIVIGANVFRFVAGGGKEVGLGTTQTPAAGR